MVAQWLHRFFEDTRTQITLLLIVLDLGLGVVASVVAGGFRLSFVADFMRNDVLGKVVPFFMIYGGFVYAKNADLVIPGVDFDVVMNGAWVVVTAALVGSLLSQRATFLLVPLFSTIAAACVVAIPATAIDHRRARGAEGDREDGGTIRGLLCHGPLLVLAAALFLFHLANAAMLPLVGQKLALLHRGYESAMMSACIIAAQFVMLPVALCCGACADRIGRRPLLLTAFAILPMRGVLYTLNDAPEWLIAVQLLDGVGAGALGVLVPLLVADLTRGTGRFNLSFAAVATTGGIGAAVSNAGAGAIVVAAGYDTAFLALAVVAITGFALVWIALPETAAGGSPLVNKSRTCQPLPY